jgi:hypothetical protein
MSIDVEHSRFRSEGWFPVGTTAARGGPPPEDEQVDDGLNGGGWCGILVE